MGLFILPFSPDLRSGTESRSAVDWGLGRAEAGGKDYKRCEEILRMMDMFIILRVGMLT